MEEILPFLVVAIILISSALQTRRQQRRKQQAQPAMPPRVPQAPAMDIEPTAVPVQPTVSEIRPKPTAVSRPTVTTSQSAPAQTTDALKASASEQVQPEVMRHFDLKQAILYSEIMTPKF